MSQILGPAFGLGTNGQLNITEDTVDTQIGSAASGTIATTNLTATNVSFATGQLILIHQTTGSAPGIWEMNRIASYSPGTITTALPLTNTYTTSGNDRAQVVVVKEYTGINISSGKTLTGSYWNAASGGIFPLVCSGYANITGILSAIGCGLTGGQNAKGVRNNGIQGSGETGVAGINASQANSTGGGGGDNDHGDGGAGGGHVNAGSDGTGTPGGAYGGLQSAVDTEDLTTVIFGGGGGAGGIWDAIEDGRGGATGGGWIYLIARNLVVTGSINVSGATGGQAATDSREWFGAGGGGAGGSLLIKSQTASIGTNLLKSLGGAGGAGTSRGYAGGAGSVGRMRLEACSLTGATDQGSFSTNIGGFSYCGSLVSIIS